MRERIRQAIYAAIDQVNQDFDEDRRIVKADEAELFGKTGALDSLGLVTFVVAVEEQLEKTFGVIVTLADERALLQTDSPFQSVGAMMNYIELLMGER